MNTGEEKRTRLRIKEALCGRLSELLFHYREMLEEFAQRQKPLPRPVAYELQHAVTHLTHSYLCGSAEDRWRQYGRAVEHLERGVLDAYKLLLFEPAQHAGLGLTQEFSELIQCRLSEYGETGNARIEPQIVIDNHAIRRYRSLYQKISPAPAVRIIRSRPDNFPPEAKPGHLAFFASIHEWGQCELVLSALIGNKSIPRLRDMMDAVFHNFSVHEMQTAMANLYRDIAHAALSGVARSLFAAWVQSDPVRFCRYDTARKAMLGQQSEQHAIKTFVQQDIFCFYKIRLTPYQPC